MAPGQHTRERWQSGCSSCLLAGTFCFGAYWSIPGDVALFKKTAVANTPVRPAESAAVKRRGLEPETESCPVKRFGGPLIFGHCYQHDHNPFIYLFNGYAQFPSTV